MSVTEPDSHQATPIRSASDLVEIFADARKPRADWRVGAEMEKFGVAEATGVPIDYDGDRGVLKILRALAERHGWAPESEKPGGPILSLGRGKAQITLEPGSQLELSGSPFNTIHEICSEFHGHMEELGSISKELGVRWMGLGFHPFAKRAELGFVPKARYAIMNDYLPTRGGHALDMMQRTCTVQANFDYDSEKDAMQKMRVGLKLSPLTTAIFANSPWYEGAPHGGLTYRGKVWLDVDPDRSGLLPGLFGEKASFEGYAEWALDVPMFLIKRGGQVLRNTGQTFRTFWKSGFEGHHATTEDWHLHLNTMFPEVRLKKTIEIRGADAQGRATRCALPALWTGIYYDQRALDACDAMTADWTHAELDELRRSIWQKGLRAIFRGKSLVETAQRVVEIADQALERRAMSRSDGKDERVHLAKLKELVARGKTPADALLEDMGSATDFRREVMDLADLTPR